MVTKKTTAQHELQPINIDSLAYDINGVAELLICADEMLRCKFKHLRDFDRLCHMLSAIRAQVGRLLAQIENRDDGLLPSIRNVLEDTWLTLDHALDTAVCEFDSRRDFDLFSARLRGASAANKLVHLELINDDAFAAAKHASKMLASFEKDSEAEVA